MPSQRAVAKRGRSAEPALSPPPIRRKLDAATATQRTVSEFFTSSASAVPGRPTRLSWRVEGGSLLVGSSTANGGAPGGATRSDAGADDEGAQAVAPRRKIAAFDLDSTLVVAASGARFGRSATDWKWWHASVPARVRQLHADGFEVVVFTNQAGLAPRRSQARPRHPDPTAAAAAAPLKLNDSRVGLFKAKTGAISAQLAVPLRIFAAAGHDTFRKPRTGMWARLASGPGQPAIDRAASFFVGDAAGRPADPSRRRGSDFSCVDRDFAANVGIEYLSPEQFFLAEAAQPFTRPFEPSAYLDAALAAAPAPPFEFHGAGKAEVEMLVFCGSPASGKSTFYWRHLQPLGYERINQDILRTRERCVVAAEDSLKRGVPVAIDAAVRAVWLALAQRYGVGARCVHFTAPAALCQHNDAVRALAGNHSTNPEQRSKLPDVAFQSFAARYRAPAVSEGFGEIITVDFQFAGSDEQAAVWRQYWV